VGQGRWRERVRQKEGGAGLVVALWVALAGLRGADRVAVAEAFAEGEEMRWGAMRKCRCNRLPRTFRGTFRGGCQPCKLCVFSHRIQVNHLHRDWIYRFGAQHQPAGSNKPLSEFQG
jgi:hypothetical protein